jgi:hypothetical protein
MYPIQGGNHIYQISSEEDDEKAWLLNNWQFFFIECRNASKGKKLKSTNLNSNNISVKRICVIYIFCFVISLVWIYVSNCLIFYIFLW